MLNSDKESGAQGKEAFQAYQDALVVLQSELDALYKEVESQADNLLKKKEYLPEALGDISSYFEEISMKFSDSLTVTDADHYEILRRSPQRKAAARKVETVAAQIAVQFETYSLNPALYSAVKGRLQINKLLGAIKNLKACCRLKG